MADEEDEMTNCPVCFEAYEVDGERVPRMLLCHHTMCERCIRDLMRGKTFIICPECRKKYHAWNGVRTFSQNKYIVLHIQKEKAKRMEMEDTQRHEKSKAAEMSIELCIVHNRVANIYCVEKTCEQPICPWCLKVDHKDHNFEDLLELKTQMFERLMTKLVSLTEDLLERRQKLNVKYADVGKTIAEFNLNLITERIGPNLMYDALITFRLQITENMRVTEEKIDIVKNMMETTDTSTITLQDITNKLCAANKIMQQTFDKIQRQKKLRNKRCQSQKKEFFLEEDDKILPLVSGLSLQEEEHVRSVGLAARLTRSSLKLTETRAIYTKYQTIACPLLRNDRTVVVFGRENGQTIMYEYNSPPVDALKRRIDNISGCLACATLVDEKCFVVPNRDKQIIEFITEDARVSKHVNPRHPGALCMTSESTLLAVDESAFPRQIFQLDCSKMPPAKVLGLITTYESDIYNICCVKHQNKELIITTNGVNGVSAYGRPTGEFHWRNLGIMPGTEKVMYASGVAADRRGHIFVCDSANECIQLFTADGMYLGEAFRTQGRGRPDLIRWCENLSSLAVTFELAGKWSVHIIKVE